MSFGLKNKTDYENQTKLNMDASLAFAQADDSYVEVLDSGL